jgi:hypothetical protein
VSDAKRPTTSGRTAPDSRRMKMKSIRNITTRNATKANPTYQSPSLFTHPMMIGVPLAWTRSCASLYGAVRAVTCL